MMLPTFLGAILALHGLTVRLGEPVEVTRQLGWGVDWPHPEKQAAYAFIHLTPSLARFPGGELIATYALDPDTRENPVCLSAFQISRDGGRTWGRRYGVLPEHNAMTFIAEPGDSLLGLSADLTELRPSDDTDFTGPTFLFERGGRRITITPEGMRILGWPWRMEVIPATTPRDNWIADITVVGSSFQRSGRIFATAIAKRKGARFAESDLIASADGGRIWHYFSTIAEADPSLASEPGYAGPDETAVTALANGELMAVVRVGGTERWKLLRTYSADGGRTWTKPDLLPAWSVRPNLLRLANGTLALSTGRPGIYLWLSTDPRAREWQKVDLVAHHNSVVPDPDARIGSFLRDDGTRRWQTCSYTNLVETSPNHLLLIYDRDAERRPTGPTDLSRVYVLPIEIGRR